MARYRIDDEGVSHVGTELTRDSAALRQCAVAVSGASTRAERAVGDDAPELGTALARFGSVHAFALDALAQATDALGGRVDLAAAGARDVETVAASVLATAAGAG